MTIAFLLPFVVALVFLAVIARTTVFRPRPHKIDHVILFVRKLDVSDFELLLDAGQEWTLRQSLSNETFRTTQEDRIRLIREYLRRVAHNVEAIHVWIAGEYELIKDKDRNSYSEKDALVLEALQLAIDLRLYSLVARVKVWSWTVFRMHRWPALLFPGVTDLRVQCGVNVLAKYRRLTEIAAALSLMQGKAYHDRLLEAL
jgi:hypothetical protein